MIGASTANFANPGPEGGLFRLDLDLRLTTSQLNEYMKTEITRKLQDEFTKYEQFGAGLLRFTVPRGSPSRA